VRPEAAWRRWLDLALSLVGLDDLAVFQKRPASVPAVRLEEVSAARPEQVNLGEPPATHGMPARRADQRPVDDASAR
jgi:hypothetical protein